MPIHRRSLKMAALGLMISLAVIQCRESKQQPAAAASSSPDVTPANARATAGADALLPLGLQVLISHSHGAPLHHCVGEDSIYPDCASPHTMWAPPVNDSLKKIGDTVFSRILLEQKMDDSTTVFIIENQTENNDCHACAPTLSAAIARAHDKDVQDIPDLGGFGQYGRSPEHIRVVRNAKGGLYMRTEWSDLHQGEVMSGIDFTSLSSPPRNTVVETEGDDSGDCDSTANTCYAFKYAILNEGPVLPDTLKLKGGGTYMRDDGKIETIGDTIITIR